MKLEDYANIIKNGDVVAFPTETVYGLGADATNLDAIQKVYELKGRPSDNPLIVHLSNLDQIRDYVVDIPKVAEELIQEFWPGPLTLILEKKTTVLDAVTAGLPTVALRIPNRKEALELIDLTGPLVAPSANISGKPSPTKAEHVKEDFGNDFPVIDGGATLIGLESTVLDITSEPYCIYRPGFVTKEEIEIVTGTKVIYVDHSEDKPSPSPGVRYSHYAPKASVQWYNGESITDESLYLFHTQSVDIEQNVIHFDGMAGALGQQLYDLFRMADRKGYKNIFIETFENKDTLIFPALINRIQKAIG